MKKILFLLLFITGFLQAQTLQNPTYGNTTTNTLKIKTPATVTSVNFLSTNEADGSVSKIAPINVTIPYTPVNYAISNQSIGQHLTGIDTRLGQISSTTAGLTQRVYFTADNTVVNAVTYFASSLSGKGSTATGSPPALVLPDNTKAFFTKDVISIAQPSATIGYAGTYSGNLTVSATPTPVATQQRFTVEIYRTNNLGVPIASGVSGAPTGDLGVTVLAILDSGIINLSAGSITNIPVSGILTQNVTINTGERLRYHVSAAKIGTGGGSVTFGVYYGTSYNSYYDIPVAITTDAVLNKSTVTGAVTATDALNYLYNSTDFPVTAYVQTTGNNSTAQLGNIKRPFLTIDAALDALPSTGGVIKIGVGSFLSPTLSKIKDNTKFIGSGKPYPNMTISYPDENTKPVISSPTKLLGGTIINGSFVITGKNNIEIRDIGIDVGKEWIDANNGGIPVNGLWHAANLIGNSTDNNLIPPSKGIVIENISSLNYSATALVHAVVLENITDAKIDKISTYYGTHGVVIKGRGINLTNVISYGHASNGVVIKANNYAYSSDINVSDVYISSIGNFDGGGFRLVSESGGNLQRVNVNNLNVEHTTFGVYDDAGVDGFNLSNVSLYHIQDRGLYIQEFSKRVFINNVSVDGVQNENGIQLVSYNLNNDKTISNVNVKNCPVNGMYLYAVGGVVKVSNINVVGNIQIDGGATSNVRGFNVNATGTFSGSLVFDNSGSTEKLSTIDATGKINKSIVSVTSSGGINLPLLSGTGTRTVVALSDGSLSATSIQPLKYVALLTQSGTSAPTATVLENSLGGSVVWTRTATGTYRGTLSGAFPANKTAVFANITNVSSTITVLPNTGAPNSVEFTTSLTSTITNTDGLLNVTSFRIEVYP